MEVEINKTLLNGFRKLCYFRLAEILFNDKARNVFHAIESLMEGNQNNDQSKNDEEVGVCFGYLGLLISIVGYIAGSRLWFNFTFKGSKSTVKLADGTVVVMRPR